MVDPRVRVDVQVSGQFVSGSIRVCGVDSQRKAREVVAWSIPACAGVDLLRSQALAGRGRSAMQGRRTARVRMGVTIRVCRVDGY